MGEAHAAENGQDLEASTNYLVITSTRPVFFQRRIVAPPSTARDARTREFSAGSLSVCRTVQGESRNRNVAMRGECRVRQERPAAFFFARRPCEEERKTNKKKIAREDRRRARKNLSGKR